MANTHLALVPPAIDNRTVTPRRRPNRELRPREHLTEREVEMLIEAARANRWGQRDSTMILIGFRHACALQSCASFNGPMWSSSQAVFICAEPRAAPAAPIHCWAMNCGRCRAFLERALPESQWQLLK